MVTPSSNSEVFSTRQPTATTLLILRGQQKPRNTQPTKKRPSINTQNHNHPKPSCPDTSAKTQSSMPRAISLRHSQSTYCRGPKKYNIEAQEKDFKIAHMSVFKDLTEDMKK